MDQGLNGANVVLSLAPHHDPVAALRLFQHLSNLTLLHSAAPGHPLSRYSYLMADPVDHIAAGAPEWPRVRERIRALTTGMAGHTTAAPFAGGWCGYVGYEVGHLLHELPYHSERNGSFPDIALGLYDWVIAWDHVAGTVTLISTGIDVDGFADATRAKARAADVLATWNVEPATEVPWTAVDMRADTRADDYRDMVAATIDAILSGEIFQANIAQRFCGTHTADPVALYSRLTARTPAPMAAYLAHGDATVISASPEQFLAVTRDGHVSTRPIKGTRPRSADSTEDAALAAALVASEKDRAENVMIVDLLRNDLSRVCEPMSVCATALCALESHPTVHHLVSTVVGTLRAECDAIGLVDAAFPGGSVTGAPKRRAMEIIAAVEPVSRDVYTGMIGWFGLDGAMDSSIVIRTIVQHGNTLTLHVGGGITARSHPVDEYHETLDKARALLDALGSAS